MILVKAEGNLVTRPVKVSGPSNFPVSPPSNSRASRPVSGVNTPCIPLKMVDQELGAGANPAGTGGADGNTDVQFDDRGSVPQEQKLDEINSEHPSFYSNKKKSCASSVSKMSRARS